MKNQILIQTILILSLQTSSSFGASIESCKEGSLKFFGAPAKLLAEEACDAKSGEKLREAAP